MTDPKTPPRNRGGQECPVCGKTTYSAGGIHPQCAVVQRDQQTKQELLEKKKDDSANKKSKPSARWQKKCPKCKSEVHVRLKKCECGHEF